MQDSVPLAGQVVVVTGAGSGLGAALCQQLAAERAHVFAFDINEPGLREMASRLSDDGMDVQAMAGDVGTVADVQAIFKEATVQHGGVDAVINCAGIDVTAPIEDVDVDDWERVLRTNLTGPFILSKLALAALRPSGHIVNVASTAARRGWPNASAYHASKWGLAGLSQALHAELRPRGIRVSVVIAGGMQTPFLLDRFPDIDVMSLQDPARVARAICFVLTQPEDSVVPEIMVLPMKETSWP
ncbi:MAG TPA: SDR family oxidoreductase [Burkholderiaceae bacterium]|nr:SDR family oxidoreductase [Burkholderiaceae bacterium]